MLLHVGDACIRAASTWRRGGNSFGRYTLREAKGLGITHKRRGSASSDGFCGRFVSRTSRVTRPDEVRPDGSPSLNRPGFCGVSHNERRYTHLMVPGPAECANCTRVEDTEGTGAMPNPSAVVVPSVTRLCWERRRSMLNSYPCDRRSHTSMDGNTYACMEATPGRLWFTGASWGDDINQTASPRGRNPGNW